MEPGLKKHDKNELKMRNHPLYKQLKQIVLDNNYTIEQIQQMGFNEAAQLLGTRDFTETFLNNMKRGLVDTVQERDDKADFQKVRQRLKTWLDDTFPDWQIERGQEGIRPYIKIWLKGKPNASSF